FKACLFLGAGSVIHAGADNQDMRVMGGLRRYMPYTAGAFVLAWLAIAGVPPFSGFFAKDDVLAKAFTTHNYALYAVGLVAAVLTGLYMTREVFLTFFSNERFRKVSTDASTAAEVLPADAPAHPAIGLESPTVAYGTPPRPPVLDHDPHESPPIMTLPVVVVGLL